MRTSYPKTKAEAINRTKDWLSKGALFLDTETTGYMKTMK